MAGRHKKGYDKAGKYVRLINAKFPAPPHTKEVMTRAHLGIRREVPLSSRIGRMKLRYLWILPMKRFLMRHLLRLCPVGRPPQNVEEELSSPSGRPCRHCGSLSERHVNNRLVGLEGEPHAMSSVPRPT